jgi:hypothetical protein
MTTNSPIERKFARVGYYLRNIARDLSPQSIFRWRLDAIFRRIGEYDVDDLSRRLNYYNKLSGYAPAGPYTSTIGDIPMAKSMYYYDLKEHARYFPRDLKLNHVFGDVTHVPARPAIVKSRPIGGNNHHSVLMKLEKFRHFYFPRDRSAFRDKKPMAVWRGGTHNPKRMALLALPRDPALCDVGQTHGERAAEMRKRFLSPVEQMQFRYIISIEGNDVATNLKWILASNSLCIMPKPVYETWFMEGSLAPGRHYAEVRDDFSNLEETIGYYEDHLDEAGELIHNANEHARQFFDERREQLLSLLVLHRYFVVTGQVDDNLRLESLGQTV